MRKLDRTNAANMRTSMTEIARDIVLILLAAAYFGLVGPVAGQQAEIDLSAYALQPSNNLVFYNMSPLQIQITNDAVSFSILDDTDPPTPWYDFEVTIHDWSATVTVNGDGVYPNISQNTTVNSAWFVAFGGSVVPVDGGFTVTFKDFPDGTPMDLTPTPEPSTLALLGIGTFGLLAYMVRRRGKA
jgi:hypothetical protein